MSTALILTDAPASPVQVPVLLPSTGVPGWVTNRGGDVRAHDLDEGRDVYGPGHHFAVPAHIRITNGLIRADCGPHDELPHLAISAYKDGAWRSKGYLYFGESHDLAGARLVAVTPDRATLVLSVRNEGHVTITLRRGERGLHVRHGSTRAPVSLPRLIQWRSGAHVPPGAGEGWGDGNWGDGDWGGTYVVTGTVNGSPVTNGLAYETTVDGGTTRAPDANGLTRALSTLRSGASKPLDFGLAMRRTGVSVDYFAFIATDDAGDDLVDYHAQSAAASEQETRIR